MGIDTLKIPEHVPENGFYYHYKHDPAGEVNNYAYEIVGVGHHTEISENFVVYRPLYESSVYKAGKMFDLRPLVMFMEPVTKEGETYPRFKKINDQETISKLEKIRSEMY